MDFLTLAENRFSVRDFLNKEIEKEKMDKILKAAQIAPTAKNNQPQKIYILKSKEAIDKIRDITVCAFNAPVVLLICADSDISWKSPFEPEYNSGEMDASIVATHIMLEAFEQGIGSVWVRRFDVAKTKEAFNLPSNISPICLIPMGYSAEGVKPTERHFQNKEIKEFVIEI